MKPARNDSNPHGTRFARAAEMRRLAWMLGLGLIAGAAGWIQGCSGENATPPHYELGFDAQLARDTGASWTVIADPDYGTPSFLEPRDPTAPRLVGGATAESAARDFFKKYSKQLGIKDPDRELVLEESGTDELGMAYAAFLQKTLAGTPVFGNRLTVHYAVDGSIGYIAGRIAPNAASISATPTLSDKQAIAAASTRLLSEVSGADPTTLKVTEAPNLLVYAPNASAAALAYELAISVYGPSASGHRVYLVDATTGGILFEYGAEQTLTGSGHGALYYAPAPLTDKADTKSFEIEINLADLAQYGLPPYIMQREGSPSESAINVSQPLVPVKPELGEGVVRSTDPNVWDVAGRGSAVDAYYYFSLVDQHYRKVHNRHSYDDANAPLKIVVHDRSVNDNGAWVGGEKLFRFGEPVTKFKLTATTDLDICAHEFQHAVTQATVGLVYADQPGALNESISDIFACFVESDLRPGPENLHIGDVSPTAVPLRAMGAPGFGTPPQPDHMNDARCGTDDDGGVHLNSGIPNNAWYLMTFGGTNKTSGITVNNPLNWQLSERLWYSILLSKALAKTAKFKDAALATTAAAKALPGADDLASGPVSTVACAWQAVGVLTAKEVQDNWKISCDVPDSPPDAGPKSDACATATEAGSESNTIVPTSCSHKTCETGAALGKDCDACTAQICLNHPECCDPTKSWTDACVTAVQNVAGPCAGACYDGNSTCTHGECAAGAGLPSSCSTCAASVCKIDPFCCTNTWDIWCAHEAERSAFCSCKV